MVHTVGLLAHNGYIGSATLTHLLPAWRSGQIKLVILHRSASDTSNVPSGVEKRIVDLDADVDSVRAALTGIHVLISAITTEAVLSQLPLVEALAGSPDLITFIPSEYAFVWTDEEFHAYPGLGFLRTKDEVNARARQLHVPLTVIKTGLFLDHFFIMPQFGSEVKTNTVQLYANSRQDTAPFSTVAFLGAGTAQLAIRDPQRYANKTVHLNEFLLNGQDFISAYSEAHGSKADTRLLTEPEWTKQMEAGGVDSVVAGIKRKWGESHIVYPEEEIEVERWESKSLPDLVRAALHA